MIFLCADTIGGDFFYGVITDVDQCYIVAVVGFVVVSIQN